MRYFDFIANSASLGLCMQGIHINSHLKFPVSLSKYTFAICYMSINDILHPHGLVGPTSSNVACVAGHKRNDLVNQNMVVNDALFNSIINLLKNATNLQHLNNKF